MLALSGSVALGYFVIALVVAPRIRMPSASPRVVLLVRGAAIMFFLGCGLTHLHILVHTHGVGGRVRPVEAHDLAIHVMQAVGAWLFIVGAALKLELHVVASDRTARQRDVARAKLAAQQVITAAFERRAARASALARMSEQALTQRDPADFARHAATVVREALPHRCSVSIAEHALAPVSPTADRLLMVECTDDCDDGDMEFIASANNVITSAVRRLHLEEKLRFRSLHDPLTGLPNRVLLMDRLEQALNRTMRSNLPVSVLFIDLDGFKRVNDALGHEAGDQLLGEVAARLRAVARSEDTVARQSGDEFILVCERTDATTALDIARRIAESVSRPYPLVDGGVHVTTSIGIATSDRACAAEELLRRADTAMYYAKQRGPGGVETYGEALRARIVRKEQIDRNLRGALIRGEFSLVYQPIVGLPVRGRPEQVIGAEALLRWHHGVDGPVPPAEFIPVAEARGLITPIGEWVIAQACAQAARWRAQMPEDEELLMAINLSARQLAEPDFASKVRAAVLAAGARPADIVVELTETAITDGDQESAPLAATLRELRAFGMRVALDDFGTGYSSLTHLRTLPLDILKVDSSFVAGLGKGGNEQAIVTALAGLTEDLGVQVVAEGVETPEQLIAVRNLRFHMAQGFLLGHPMRPAEIADLLPIAGVDAVAERESVEVRGRDVPSLTRRTDSGTAPSSPSTSA
jgi:diguanylate cyclase (GGDEF)-like protein